MFADGHRLIDAGILLIGLTSCLAAAVGLPLYGDGALYFVEIVLEAAPLVPNGRYSAVLAQLPVVAAMARTQEIIPLRHAFSLGYALLPFLCLFACWLIVRRSAPGLILYPALFLVANQSNFSAVSELLLGLYLAWPFVLMVGLYPGAAMTLTIGGLLAPILLFLHPLEFLVLFFLGLVGLVVKRRLAPKARGWGWLSALFLILGLLRLLWSVFGANEYERSHISMDATVGYLFPDSAVQTALLGAVLVLGVVIAARRRFRTRGWHAISRLVWPIGGLTALLGLVVAVEIWTGEGVKLKSAVVYPLALILMVLALFEGWRPSSTGQSKLGDRLFFLLSITIMAISLSKIGAWSRATDELARAMAESEDTCVPFEEDEPPALQYPHMTLIDNWTAPMNALIFRAGQPLVLLLPADGCRKLAETDMAYLTPWFGRSREQLERRFGPSREH